MDSCDISSARLRGEPRALGRRNSSADTIGDILRAASEEFASYGFDCTTVDGIARKANVSKQLLYYYFGTKAELYSSILDEAAKNSPEFALDIDIQNFEPECALREFMDTVFADYERRPWIARMTIDEAQHNFEHVDTRSPLAERLRNAISMLDRILVKGVESGSFRRGLDADAVFWTIFGLVTNWFAHSGLMKLVSGDKLEGETGFQTWRESSQFFLLNSVRSLPSVRDTFVAPDFMDRSKAVAPHQ